MQLQYLNGYDIHAEQGSGVGTYTAEPHRLISTEGVPVDYNSSKQLLLLGAKGTPLGPPGPFEFITLNDSTFDAVGLNGAPLQVPLQDIKSVEIVQPAPEKTEAFVTLLSILGSLLLVGATLAAAH